MQALARLRSIDTEAVEYEVVLLSDIVLVLVVELVPGSAGKKPPEISSDGSMGPGSAAFGLGSG
jgi:hypothetical protein